jgi:acyl-CoA synthetase (NDP forming)
MKSVILQELSKKGIEILNEFEARNVLREYNIPCPKEVMIEYVKGKKGKEYLSELTEMDLWSGYPVFLKIVSRDIGSKTDAGVVKRVMTAKEAEEAINTLIRNAKRYNEKIKIQGILVSEDASSKETREIILGSTVDSQFGHGIYVEIYKDIEFRVIPIEESDVYSMIRNLKAKDILGKFRGMRPVNIDLIVDTALKLSKIIEENPEIIELDVNPLLVGPEKALAVDTIIRIQRMGD